MECSPESLPQPARPFLRALPFLLGRRVPLERLRGGKDISLLAIFLLLGVYVGRDWWFVEPERYFSSLGFAPYFTELFLIGIFVYLVTRSTHCILSLGLLLSLLLEVYFFLMLATNSIAIFLYHYSMDGYWYYYLVFSCAWIVLAIYGVLAQSFPEKPRGVVVAAAGFGMIVLLPQYYLEYTDDQFWYHDYSLDEVVEEPVRDYEQVFFSQAGLLQQQLDNIPPGVEGEIEFFYLGFGSYASEAVFKREVQYIDRWFDKKYPSRKRGVTLINHRDTMAEHPLAIQHNLKQALRGIAEKMNREEDILFLYITTHGSENHELSVSFRPFRFVDLTPDLLKQALDDAGIHWKVVIISACYSGGFIETLKNPYTLIATAADANNKSFGCSNENDFTYFGEALFHDQLARDVPLLQALPLAVAAIGEREKREKKTPSNPQLWMQEPIVEHLKKTE